MIKPITRLSLFRSSAFADHLVSGMQQSYAQSFDRSDPGEAKMLKRYYDHLRPFHREEPAFGELLVLACDAANRAGYEEKLPRQLGQLLEKLGAGRIYLIGLLRDRLNDFPFENFRKRNRFKLLAGNRDAGTAWLLDRRGLADVLPLFFFSRYPAGPGVLLITGDGEIPLSLNLCDDGNFHVLFSGAPRERLLEAAEGAGFLTGDVELCRTHSVSYF